jgi:hypothetical protein
VDPVLRWLLEWQAEQSESMAVEAFDFQPEPTIYTESNQLTG